MSSVLLSALYVSSTLQERFATVKAKSSWCSRRAGGPLSMFLPLRVPGGVRRKFMFVAQGARDLDKANFLPARLLHQKDADSHGDSSTTGRPSERCNGSSRTVGYGSRWSE